MRTKWTLPLLAGLVAATAAVTVGATQGLEPIARAARHAHAHVLPARHGGHDGVEAHLDALARTLELDPAQRARIAGAIRAAAPELEARALAVAAALGEQVALVHADALDEEALRAASARSGAAQGELAVALARLLGEIHAALRPEQLERIEHRHAGDVSAALAEHVRDVVRGARAWAERG